MATSSQAGTPPGAAAREDAEIRRLSIDTIRALSMDAVQKANAGHPGTAMALAPLGYTIYQRFLHVNPQDTEWPDRDRFVLSAGHACVLQYSLLHLCGYDLGLEDLEQFRQWGSRTPGHPERGHTPGIEITTGPLGQGFANAVGMAIAERFLADRFNRPGHEPVDHHVYAICSDGDMMEGISQEAASIAGNFASASLSSATTTTTSRSTARRRSRSTARTTRGACRPRAGTSSASRTQRTSTRSKRRSRRRAMKLERPSFIAIRSHIAYPAPHAVDTAKAHGSPLGEDEVRATKEVMGFDPDRSFWVDERVYEHMSLRERGAAAQAGVDGALRGVARGLSRRWRRSGIEAWAGRMRDGWREALPEFEAGEETRDALGRPEGDGGLRGIRADDDRRRGRPGGVDQDRVRGRAVSSRRCTPDATCRSGSASTRWARSSTARARTAGSSNLTARRS